jgi:hypothetical protein
MEIIDVHMHCFVGRADSEAVSRGIGELRRAGVRNLVVAGLVNTHLDKDAMWDLIPGSVENRGDALFNEAEDLLELARVSGQTIVPLVDTRHLWGDVATALKGYLRRGFRGIKGIYLDEDNDIGVRSVAATFGITPEQYRRREWEIFAFAQAHDLPLLYHIDARRHAEVVTAMLTDFPRLRVDFAHLGIGRKAFGAILDRYPRVYTDVAGLAHHVRSSPASYRDFITHYADRVCFASDALLYQPEIVLDYIRMVEELELPAEVAAQVFSGNAVRFLGSALDAGALPQGEGRNFSDRGRAAKLTDLP